MIALTRLNGTAVAINPDLITWIEITPDTTVSLIGGDKIVVRENLDLVIAKIVHFRRLTGATHGSAATLHHVTAQKGMRPLGHLRLSSVPPPPREK